MLSQFGANCCHGLRARGSHVPNEPFFVFFWPFFGHFFMFFVQMEPVKGPRAYGPGRAKCLGEIPGVAQKKFGFLTDFSKKTGLRVPFW